jgi:hypothetical protein
MAYGWDLCLIEDELNKLIQPPSIASSVFAPNALIVRISVTLGSSDGSLQPALALRLFTRSIQARIYQYLRIQYENATAISIIFGGPFFCLLIGLVVGYYASGGVPRSVFYLVLFAGLPAATLFAILLLLPVKEAIYSNIGMAWALKSWKSTGFPASNSRREVIDGLRHNNSLPAEIADDKVILQRRPDGWYLMEGMREGDWLEANRQLIEDAIKEQRNGLLDSERLSELRMIRHRLAQYEGDDAVGISG